MDSGVTQKNSQLKQVWPDLLAFILGLSCAWYFQWSTTELVWSLWLGSLVLGYLTIVTVIGSGLYLGVQFFRYTVVESGNPTVIKAIGLGLLIFFFLFFTFHFCGFHAGHAVFLHGFFPLPSIENKNVFAGAFMNPALLWYVVIKDIIPLFGLFLIPVAIAERRAILRPFFGARDFSLKLQGKSPEQKIEKKNNTEKTKKAAGKNNPLQEAMIGPYRNVIRMHLLIFAFAGLSVVGLESFAVFALVYAVYFFPWQGIFGKNSD